MEWSFRVFWDFLECVIMGKRGRSEKYFISCAVSGPKRLRICKTPANAHEIKYFSELEVGNGR